MTKSLKLIPWNLAELTPSNIFYLIKVISFAMFIYWNGASSGSLEMVVETLLTMLLEGALSDSSDGAVSPRYSINLYFDLKASNLF